MIYLENVFHSLPGAHDDTWLLHNEDHFFGDRERIGILAERGSGKSSLARLLSLVDKPNFGTIAAHGSVSWPIGIAGIIHQHLSVEKNLEIILQLSTREPAIAVDRFNALIETDLDRSCLVAQLSPSERALFAYALSMMIPRQHYIFDDKITVGTKAQRDRQSKLLSDDLKTSGLVLISSNRRLLSQHCLKFLQLELGSLVQVSLKDFLGEELAHV